MVTDKANAALVTANRARTGCRVESGLSPLFCQAALLFQQPVTSYRHGAIQCNSKNRNAKQHSAAHAVVIPETTGWVT
jgi:hypothetical protein